MQKYPDYLSRTYSEPSPFQMDDGTVVFISRTPMKGVYSRHKTQALVMTEPGKLGFRATMTAKLFSILLIASGISLITYTLTAGLFVSFVFGGILLLGIGIFSAHAFIECMTCFLRL